LELTSRFASIPIVSSPTVCSTLLLQYTISEDSYICDIHLCSYISYSTWSKANSFVMLVTAVLLFCYCKLYVMALPQCDSLKQLYVSHEPYHSDDYFPKQFMSFLLSVGCAVMTSILYFPLTHWHITFCNTWRTYKY